MTCRCRLVRIVDFPRTSGIFQFSFDNWRFLVHTQVSSLLLKVSKKLASSCTTCLFMKSCQRTLSFSALQDCFPESVCKGTAFCGTAKTFPTFFSRNMHFADLRWFKSQQDYINTFYYIYACAWEFEGYSPPPYMEGLLTYWEKEYSLFNVL